MVVIGFLGNSYSQVAIPQNLLNCSPRVPQRFCALQLLLLARDMPIDNRQVSRKSSLGGKGREWHEGNRVKITSGAGGAESGAVVIAAAARRPHACCTKLAAASQGNRTS